jgi:hypothetical protein
MSKPLPITGCGEGCNLDLPASELPPNIWSGGENVCFRNGFARNRKGFTEAFTTPTAIPYWLDIFTTATARFVVQAGTASVFVDDGSTRTDITGTPPTGGVDDRWTGGDYNTILVINNGVDAPMYWNGDTGTNLASLTNWPANYTCQTLRPFKDYLVAGNIFDGSSTNPQLVMWSSSAEAGSLPSTWTAAATNDAGDDPFSGVGPIVDFLPLGDVNIVYGQYGRVSMQWVGGNSVFRFQRLPGNDGLFARGCVVQTPKGHVFLSPGDVMLHSGGEAQSIADGVCRDWLQANMDTTNATRSFLCVNQQEKEVWVCFPATGDSTCTTALAWNWESGKWSTPLSLPNLTYGASGLVSSGLASSWGSDTETWDEDITTWDQDPYSSNQARLVVATTTPKLALANTGSLDFGSSVAWHIEKYGISLGDADTLKVISRSRPHVKAVAGTQMLVKHASTLNPEDTPTFSNSSTFTVGTSTFANQFARAGRYGAVRFEGVGDQQVAIRSYEIEFGNSGARF